jgi:hypothetical protein
MQNKHTGVVHYAMPVSLYITKETGPESLFCSKPGLQMHNQTQLPKSALPPKGKTDHPKSTDSHSYLHTVYFKIHHPNNAGFGF